MRKKHLGMTASAISILGVLLISILPIYSGNSIDIVDLKMFTNSEFVLEKQMFSGLFFSSPEGVDTNFSIMSYGFLFLFVTSIASLTWACVNHAEDKEYIRRLGVLLIVSSIIFFVGVLINLGVKIDNTHNFSDYWAIGIGSWSVIFPLGSGVFFAWFY